MRRFRKDARFWILKLEGPLTKAEGRHGPESFKMRSRVFCASLRKSRVWVDVALLVKSGHSKLIFA